MANGAGEAWLNCEQFSCLVNIPIRTARYALERASVGKPVRRWPIRVRAMRGRGGKSGLRYEVALTSLPLPYQQAFRASLEPSQVPMVAPSAPPSFMPVAASKQWKNIEARWRILEPISETKFGTPARAAAIEAAAARHGKPVRTIQRWVQRAEDSGWNVDALAHQRPANAGKKRVHVSRDFDRAYIGIGGDVALLAELAAKVDQLIKAAWASKAQRAGWQQVRREVVTAFQRHCREAGIAIPESVYIAGNRVKKDADFRIVDIYDNDRKRFDDMKPRIRRDNSAFGPMDQIVMDVKPLDNIVLRADGSPGWPRMIAFQDTGTQRLFAHIVLLKPGEGVRQEHVITAFLEMVAHPEWGFPAQLYRDNGTEFAVFDMIKGAIAMIAEEGARTIVNAKPYSGASKPIESKFATLDRFVFSQMGGWAGGNRMNKKTQTVGKPPAPYPGSFDQFVKEALERIAVHETDLIGSGPFKGRSPQGVFADHVAAGWRPARVDPNALDAAFCKRQTRRIDRGGISIAGVLHRHPELASANGRTVPIALPYRRGAYPLAELPDIGWVYLTPDMAHLPGDIAGAIEAGRLQQANGRSVRRTRKQAGPIDLDQNHRDRVTALPTRAAPAPLIDVMLSDEAERFAGARIAADRARTAEPSAEARRIARQKAETEELERYLASRSATN